MVMTNAYQSSFIVQNFINIVCLTIIVSQVFIKSRFIRVSLVFSNVCSFGTAGETMFSLVLSS